MYTHSPLSRTALVRMAQLVGFSALCIAGSFLMGAQSAGDTRAMLTQSVQAGDELVKFPYGRLPDGVSAADLDADRTVNAQEAAILALRIAH